MFRDGIAFLGNLESASLVDGCSIMAVPINGDVALLNSFSPSGPWPEAEPAGEIRPLVEDDDDGNPRPRPCVTSLAMDDEAGDMVGPVDLNPPGDPMWKVIGTGPLDPSRSSVRPSKVVIRPAPDTAPEPGPEAPAAAAAADLVISAAA